MNYDESEDEDSEDIVDLKPEGSGPPPSASAVLPIDQDDDIEVSKLG